MPFALAPKPSIYGAQFLEGVENTKLKALYAEQISQSPSKCVNTDMSIQFNKADDAPPIQPQSEDGANYTILDDASLLQEDQSMLGPSGEKDPPKGRQTPPKTKRSMAYIAERDEYEAKQSIRHPDLSKKNY